MTSWDIHKIIESLVKLGIDIKGLKQQFAEMFIDFTTRLEELEYDYRKRLNPQVSEPKDREFERINDLPNKTDGLKGPYAPVPCQECGDKIVIVYLDDPVPEKILCPDCAAVAEKVESARLKTEVSVKGVTKSDTQDILDT